MDVRLWHDDVRPPPDDSWMWARTNDVAKGILKRSHVIEISLDHDLGYDGPPPGPCEACEGGGSWSEDLRYPCPACDGDGFIGGDVLYIAGGDDDNGLELVKWMVKHDLVPPKVTIHSWNPGGAENMKNHLQAHGHHPIVAPYQIR